MSVTMAELCENTKMGRECALLGSYDSAQVYYQAVLQQTQKLLLSTNEPQMKQKWTQVSLYLHLSFSLFWLLSALFSFCVDLYVDVLRSEYFYSALLSRKRTTVLCL